MRVEEIMTIAQVTERWGRKVAMRTQLEDHFITQFRKFGVAIVTTNWISRIPSLLYERQDCVKNSSWRVHDPCVLETTLTHMLAMTGLVTKEKVGNIWRWFSNAERE